MTPKEMIDNINQLLGEASIQQLELIQAIIQDILK